MLLPFTQYIRPDGKKKEIQTEVDDKYREDIQLIFDNDLSFEIEVLMNDMVSMTTTNQEYGDYQIVLSANDMTIKEKVERLIEKTATGIKTRKYEEWKEDISL